MTEEKKEVYIRSAVQISCQSPLDNRWITTDTVVCDGKFAETMEPNYRDFFTPIESRRLGIILRRAVVTAREAIRRADMGVPYGITAGTGLGCISNTELFLTAMCTQGEELLKPTYFMQSTHNTVASAVSIDCSIEGYNTTYSHKGVSFDSALFDACLQIRQGSAPSMLVGAYEEMTPKYLLLLDQIGYTGVEGEVAASETAMSMMLSTERKAAMCKIDTVRLMYRPSVEEIAECLKEFITDDSVIVVGKNGAPANDAPYNEILQQPSLSGIPVVTYKRIFGENYCASALGVYAMAECLQAGYVPASICGDGHRIDGIRRAVILNHAEGKDFSIVVMSKI